ncbi:MAG: hypothetical protein LZ170_05655 [Thaumarchaeota archaeon]|nr:hypothetical protein [Candidatus Terraquivivens yellowstonensis]
MYRVRSQQGRKRRVQEKLTKIWKCTVCGRYTLSSERCPSCGGPVKTPHPPNINLQDKYINTIVKLRREMKWKQA